MSVKQRFNEVCCKGEVTSVPQFSCIENDINFLEFKIDTKDLMSSKVVVVIPKYLLDSALIQAFVKKLYLKVNVWVKGNYQESSDGWFVIHAEDIVLIDDCKTAYEHEKISQETYDGLLKKVANSKISFKATVKNVLGHKNDTDLIGVLVRSKNWKRFSENECTLDIPSDILEKAFMEVEVFNLHVGEELLVNADLTESKLCYSTCEYNNTIAVENISIIFEEDTDKDINTDITSESFKLNQIIKSLNSLTTKQKVKVIAKSLKDGEINELMEQIKEMDIKGKFSTFTKSIRDKITK